MARYIDKEIICEAYVHLEIPDALTTSQIEEIEKRLKSFFDERVKFLLGEAVQTEIETAEGSLKVKMIAYAGIAALISGVSNYVDFRDGIKALYGDSKMLAEASNLEAIFLTKTPACDRLHAEARTGVVGRVAKVVSNLETLNFQARELTAPTTKKDISKIGVVTASVTRLDEEVRRLLEKIQSEEDKFCLAKGLHEAFSQLPTTLPAESELKESDIKKALLHKQQLLTVADSEFQRYSSAVRSAKEMLKRVGVANQTKKA